MFDVRVQISGWTSLIAILVRHKSQINFTTELDSTKKFGCYVKVHD